MPLWKPDKKVSSWKPTTNPEEERKFITALKRFGELRVEKTMEMLLETDYHTPEGLEAWREAWDKNGCIPLGMATEPLSLLEIDKIVGDRNNIQEIKRLKTKNGVIHLFWRKWGTPELREGEKP